MALDLPAEGPIDPVFAEPADEPAIAGKLLRAFSVGMAGTPSQPKPASSRAPRPAASSWPSLIVGAVLLAIGLVLLRLVASAGVTALLLFPAAFSLTGIMLLGSTLATALGQARLRRFGDRVPAVVTRTRQVLVSSGWTSRFRWQVVASATIAGQARELVSETLRDDPSRTIPPGTTLTALLDRESTARYRLLLTEFGGDG